MALASDTWTSAGWWSWPATAPAGRSSRPTTCRRPDRPSHRMRWSEPRWPSNRRSAPWPATSWSWRWRSTCSSWPCSHRRRTGCSRRWTCWACSCCCRCHCRSCCSSWPPPVQRSTWSCSWIPRSPSPWTAICAVRRSPHWICVPLIPRCCCSLCPGCLPRPPPPG